MSVCVHLVYLHGFQGKDTNFQAFPKDMQEYLSLRIPPGSSFNIKSSVYPTYKTVKPISHATKNFLEWLSTQPPGPVIILGHSMGGLLAAEAAMDAANNHSARPKRIVGVIGFDTPYLGLHPHVAVSGIGFLLKPKKAAGPEHKEESEESMNQHPDVNIVDDKVTDDWDTTKNQPDMRPRINAPYPSDTGSVLLSPAPTIDSSSPPSPSPSGIQARAISYIGAHNEPVGRWLNKHADETFSAGTRWIVEHSQFGSSLFNPVGLKKRYDRLLMWDGLWHNYWTSMAASGPRSDVLTNDDASKVNGVVDSNKEKGKTKRWFSKTEEKGPKTGWHFLILPNSMGSSLGGMEKWEHVEVAAAGDEVTAHTGLFKPHLNLEYPAMVEKVAHRILTWCDQLPHADYEQNPAVN